MTVCKCPIGWVQDPEVEGSHSSKPVTCAEYIAALEATVWGLTVGTDNDLVKELRAAHGIKAEGL